MTTKRLQVKRTAFGDEARIDGWKQGSYYPAIDGKAYGENGRAFWPTRAEAMRVGIRCLDKLRAEEALHQPPSVSPTTP
jgi:hypothetical protein